MQPCGQTIVLYGLSMGLEGHFSLLQTTKNWVKYKHREFAYCRLLHPVLPPGRQTPRPTSVVAAASTSAGTSPPDVSKWKCLINCIGQTRRQNGKYSSTAVDIQNFVCLLHFESQVFFDSGIKMWKCWHNSQNFQVCTGACAVDFAVLLDLGTFSWQSGWTFILQ